MILTHGANSLARGGGTGELKLPYVLNIDNFDTSTLKDGDVQFSASGSVTKTTDGIEVEDTFTLNAGYFLENFQNVGNRVEVEINVRTNTGFGWLYIASYLIGFTNVSYGYDSGGMWTIETDRSSITTNLNYESNWYDGTSNTVHQRWGSYNVTADKTIIVDIDFVAKEVKYYYGSKSNLVCTATYSNFYPGTGASAFNIFCIFGGYTILKNLSIKNL